MVPPRSPTRRQLLGAAVAAAGAGSAAVLLGAGPPWSRQRPDVPTTTTADGRARTPEEHGAVGDGSTDDGPALQRALDALAPGEHLRLAPGRVYRHDDVLVVRRAGALVVGPGTLLAGREERSALQVEAPGVRLADVRLEITGTSRRWTGLEQHRLVLGRHDGIVVERVVVVGSAGAGVFVQGARRFVLTDVEVEDTRADGVHMTAGASDGLVQRPLVTRSGDDGVGVVSYADDRAPVRGVTVVGATVMGTTWGRGISVVGGEDVRYERPRIERSSAAAVYVATEGEPFYTRSTRRVQVLGAQVREANHDVRVDHGAILVFAGNAGSVVEDVAVDGAVVRDTRAGAARQVGVLADDDAAVRGVVVRRLEVDGGGNLVQVTAGPGSLRAEDWVVDGRPVDDPVRT